ncbi:ribonuclease inhibitor-like [Silurus meridionalis]|uniref:Uncharacterized protein n=1 Tax=Silurus meridionalis TaxID=175797 RepID=A0A8T0AIV3_SILME|nr:ribonuclease inhibitor-like [Silurus meridionalis]XP_046690879.1 ribonuclease inhibitor-like [Silurus meridionalis]XP_046690880.1 ribonuclease inhibitor-like [Silurus meridionalis]KAF7691450.1 hypothetical protein HF521_011747 [Silurus meridionalis]
MEIPDQGTDHVTSPSKDCKLQRDKSHSPVPSFVSMKSDESMDIPQSFSTGISSPGHSIRCSEITGRSGEALTSVLKSETSSLRQLHLTVNTLDLSGNNLEDSGVKRLSALLENPECKVKDLRLYDCGVSDEGCAALASALRSNPSPLRDLDLSLNKVGDSGVKCLSAVLENPHCKLEILRLAYCVVSEEGCAALASALRSNPSHLRKLNLSGNKVGDSGVKCLSDLKDDERYRLQTLIF